MIPCEDPLLTPDQNLIDRRPQILSHLLQEHIPRSYRRHLHLYHLAIHDNLLSGIRRRLTLQKHLEHGWITTLEHHGALGAITVLNPRATRLQIPPADGRKTRPTLLGIILNQCLVGGVPTICRMIETRLVELAIREHDDNWLLTLWDAILDHVVQKCHHCLAKVSGITPLILTTLSAPAAAVRPYT